MVNFWFMLAVRLATFSDCEARFECAELKLGF